MTGSSPPPDGTARFGHDALAEALAAEGVEVVFGLIGDGNAVLLVDLVERHGVRFVPVRHEQAAVAMADGYSRSSGRPGVAIVTQGPGLTHTATSLMTARANRSQVVVIAGDTPPRARLHPQNIDQSAFSLATAGAHQQVHLPETLGEDVRLAFRHVRLGRGPIVVSFGKQVQEAPMAPDWSYLPSLATLPAPQRRPPDAAMVTRAAQALASSERPVVIAGRGAVLADARDTVLALADRLGAPLATTLLAKGWFADEAFDLGVAGGFSTPLAREVLGAADCVLVFGASLNRFTVDKGKLFPQARVIQVDVDPGAVGDPQVVDLAVLGDSKVTADALLQQLGAPSGDAGWRSLELRRRIGAQEPPTEDGLDPDPAAGVHPLAVVTACDELIPGPRGMVVDIGQYAGWAAQHFTVDDPTDIVLPWQLASMGLAIPAAVGAAIAKPDVTMVTFVGDGALMMSLPELDTAARCDVPVLVVVLDDDAYGAEIYILNQHDRNPELARIKSPDIAALAAELGMDAHRAMDLAHLRAILRDLGRITRPTLVHVKIQGVMNQAMFAGLDH